MAVYASVALDLPLKQHFSYLVEPEQENAVCMGKRVIVPFGSREITGYVLSVSDTYDGVHELKSIKRVVDDTPLYGQNLIDLASWMSRYYFCSPGEALGMMIPGGRKEVGLPALEIEDDVSLNPVEHLSEEQEHAIQTILRREKSMYYLYGVTGSGKSEVFLRTAEAVIAEGKSVIYLVPEITLTHQLARQVATRFANKVAVLHSGLTPSQRLKEWKRIRSGEVQLAIGARSAVFAPFENLGLIILDEEHENSYKSGNTPRYHARQVAQQRCRQEGAFLVMGSATPSLEAYYMMQEGSQLQALHLKHRVAGGSMPTVEVVDLKGEKTLVSETLRRTIGQTLAKGKQVILFLNRRGFSYSFHCNSCGYEMECPNCSVSLTYHKKSEQMVCHYCGYRRPPIRVCPQCGSVDVLYSGFGTEMVEQQIRSLFPEAKIERLDADTVKEKGHIEKTITAFRNGEIDILLGTQMVAKGLNFPKVELVGIILADSGMNIPDFRSQERTFSLLVQVSGRAGRFSSNGRVIIQTYRPQNPAIQCALEQDDERFYTEELLTRKETGFPPYSRLVNLVLRGRNQAKVIHETEVLESLLDSAAQQLEAEVLTSGECPLEMIASNYRCHILLSAKDGSAVHRLVASALSVYSPPSGVYLEVDFDPLQLL